MNLTWIYTGIGAVLLIVVPLLLLWQKQMRIADHLLRLQRYLEDFSKKTGLLDELKHDQQLLRDSFTRQLMDNRDHLQKTQHGLQQTVSQQVLTIQHTIQTALSQHQIANLKTLQTSLQQGMKDTREQLQTYLRQQSEYVSAKVSELNQTTDKRLQQISTQVEERLSKGFEKTTETFANVLKRLALIDEAQKKITELSTDVVSLQAILSDKRSRGAFGEVQLNALVRNVLPESHFALQYTLKNNKRVDCCLFLPEPTGNVTIDAKFPLESYQRMLSTELSASDRRRAEIQFKHDLKHHINDIAEKYIIPGQTADGAMMFIPAEAVFAEIHAHHADLVEYAQKSRVWLASPTTMMAILTTARSVLKDADTRKQIHVIQEHLGYLAKDFDRFQDRMTQLSRHISMAHADIEKVQTSAIKITKRFHRIEKVELEDGNRSGGIESTKERQV